jgi:predicted dienelactone hydrolase
LQTFIWYPGIVEKGAKPPYPPDASGPPYPLVIYSHGYPSDPTEGVSVFINHLVSQGYIVAGVNHKDTDDLGLKLINRPLDVLFLLNQLADLKPDNPLNGLIDTDHVGVIGYSAGSYTVLVAGGARLDPASMPDWCATSTTEAALCSEFLSDWDAMVAYHDKLVPASEDNLWTATTDNRIRAIAMIAPCFAHVIGAAGIAEVTLPIILFSGSSDTTCLPEVNTDYVYQNLGTQDHYLVRLSGRTHGTTMDQKVLGSYVSAFFGLYLQGKTDYAQYLTPDSASIFRSVTLESRLAAGL